MTTFTLDDKSTEYIDQLNKVVTKYRDTNPLLIKIFCKYADSETGSIDTRKGIFAILSEPMVGILIQDSLPYMILNPSKILTAETDHLKGLDYKLVKREVLAEKLEKVEKLLAVRAEPWFTSIGEVRAIWIAFKFNNVVYRSIDLTTPGYFFTALELREGWEDIYAKTETVSSQSVQGSD